ncbi:hypothetical protein VNO80_30405 [Phaseolus coccineus]|uniref:Uncharacterized protein n=1 Tax=Phaseolus coccineus TaxID=3886 RepID=A0AAN9LD53_PHACN
MKLSEETVTKKMNFLVNDMGLSSLEIAAFPPILAYNLEKRIIPRFSVIKILKSKANFRMIEAYPDAPRIEGAEHNRRKTQKMLDITKANAQIDMKTEDYCAKWQSIRIL